MDVPGSAIIGLPSCERIKLVTLHCSIQAETDKKIPAKPNPISSTEDDDLMRLYPNQFDKIEDFPGEAKLVVDPEVPTTSIPQEKLPSP